jgi:hypothetical protein
MRAARATLIAVLLIGTATVATAADMVLTRNGELYRAVATADGLVVNHRLADGTVTESTIPQTAGVAASSVQVGVDELTGAVFVAWQAGVELESHVEIAWSIDEVWSGPFTIAGADGTAAENPQLMIDRFDTIVLDDNGEPIEFGATFLHLLWWSYTEDRDDGSAFLASVALDAEGVPDVAAFDPFALRDLLPYGIGCEGIQNAAGLAHPKVFVDPQSGAPHVFASDFSNCAFQILSIGYEVVEEWVGDIKRRRAITVWRTEVMIAINPDMVLASAKVEVGHGLDVVMYWDVDEAVAYVQLDENGMPPVKELPVGDGLTREQAHEMIRSLVH